MHQTNAVWTFTYKKNVGLKHMESLERETDKDISYFLIYKYKYELAHSSDLNMQSERPI